MYDFDNNAVDNLDVVGRIEQIEALDAFDDLEENFDDEAFED